MAKNGKLEIKSTQTIRIPTGCENVYLTLGEDEVFITMGKSGGCYNALIHAISRLANLALQNNIPLAKIQKALAGIRCPNPRITGKESEDNLSCIDAISKGLQIYIENKKEVVK